MDLELRINGQLTPFSLEGESTDWASLKEALVADLAHNGYEITELRLDGRVTGDVDDTCDLAVGSHVVEVTATPTPATLARLQEELATTLPLFREQTEILGNHFAKGEWKQGLGMIGRYLEDLKVILAGLQGFAVLQSGDIPPEIQRVPELLANFNKLLEGQQWVEVSDLVLYEFLPLIDAMISKQGPGAAE